MILEKLLIKQSTCLHPALTSFSEPRIQVIKILAGLLGANFAQILLNAGKFTDPITRGLSTSGAAHGLGTAAMAAT